MIAAARDIEYLDEQAGDPLVTMGPQTPRLLLAEDPSLAILTITAAPVCHRLRGNTELLRYRRVGLAIGREQNYLRAPLQLMGQ